MIKEEQHKTLLYTLAVSVDLAEYSSNNPSYCVEDIVADEVVSYLFTLSYVLDIDIRRSFVGSSKVSLIHQRRNQ